MHKSTLMMKAISIFLMLTFFSSQGYAQTLNLSSDKLSPSLITDPRINPARSTAVLGEIAGEVEPGAIGNGAPLMELAQGHLPLRLTLPDEEFTTIASKLREAIDLAIQLGLDNKKKVLEEHQKRLKATLDNLVYLNGQIERRAYLYNADVRGPEDYLLGFNFRENTGLSLEIIDRLSSISSKRLAQYIFHECVPEKGSIIKKSDHRAIYKEIQTAVFGEDEVSALKEDLRGFIDESVARNGTGTTLPLRVALPVVTAYFDGLQRASGDKALFSFEIIPDSSEISLKEKSTSIEDRDGFRDTTFKFRVGSNTKIEDVFAAIRANRDVGRIISNKGMNAPYFEDVMNKSLPQLILQPHLIATARSVDKMARNKMGTTLPLYAALPVITAYFDGLQHASGNKALFSFEIIPGSSGIRLGRKTVGKKSREGFRYTTFTFRVGSNARIEDVLAAIKANEDVGNIISTDGMNRPYFDDVMSKSLPQLMQSPHLIATAKGVEKAVKAPAAKTSMALETQADRVMAASIKALIDNEAIGSITLVESITSKKGHDADGTGVSISSWFPPYMADSIQKLATEKNLKTLRDLVVFVMANPEDCVERFKLMKGNSLDIDECGYLFNGIIMSSGSQENAEVIMKALIQSMIVRMILPLHTLAVVLYDITGESGIAPGVVDKTFEIVPTLESFLDHLESAGSLAKGYRVIKDNDIRRQLRDVLRRLEVTVPTSLKERSPVLLYGSNRLIGDTLSIGLNLSLEQSEREISDLQSELAKVQKVFDKWVWKNIEPDEKIKHEKGEGYFDLANGTILYSPADKRVHLSGASIAEGSTKIDYVEATFNKALYTRYNRLRERVGSLYRQIADLQKHIEELRSPEALMAQISKDLPVRAQIFKSNLIRILSENPDQIFFIGIETDIGESQKAQIMPIYKAIDDIKDLRGADDKPLFPNLIVRREKAKKLVETVSELNKLGRLEFSNAFIGARKGSVDSKIYDPIGGEGKAWISAIDDSIADDYIPVFEAITLNMMAYLGADTAAIKDFYDAISDKPIDTAALQDMIRNRIIYILPRAAKFDARQLKKLYELAHQVYTAA